MPETRCGCFPPHLLVSFVLFFYFPLLLLDLGEDLPVGLLYGYMSPNLILFAMDLDIIAMWSLCFLPCQGEPPEILTEVKFRSYDVMDGFLKVFFSILMESNFF